jgi:hypothetical protein
MIKRGELKRVFIYFAIFAVASATLYAATDGKYFFFPGVGFMLLVFGKAYFGTRTPGPLQPVQERLPHDNPDAEPIYERPVLSDWD